jgi:hypothetical protein
MVVTNQTETKSKTKPKRRATEEQKEASRKNGRKSRGPVTESGRSRSKYNGLIHGMASETPIILPGEDFRIIELKTELWSYETGAITDLELTFVRNAAHAWHRGQRVLRSDRDAITQTINEITAQYHERKKAEVGPLIARLPDQPLEIQVQLKQSTAGCSWILEQFQLMSEQLARYQSLGPCQFELALSLCGKHHRDLYRDGAIRDWARGHVASYYGNTTPLDLQAVCKLLHNARPEHMHPDEFSFDIERLVEKLPTRAEGNAALRRLIAAQVQELTRWRDLVAVSERVEIELEISKARTDVSREGALRHRYLQDHERAQRAALRELRQWIQLRLKYGLNLPDDDQEDGPGDVEATQAGVPAGDLAEENRSEPDETQVAGSTDDNPANSAPPAAAAATPEPSPEMAVAPEGRGTPPADRQPDPVTVSPDPTPGAPGENRSEPGETQVAGSADPGMADEGPAPVTESLRSMAAKLGVDDAEIAAMWYGRREPSVARRE